MKKINVLQITNMLDIGGTEKALQVYTENLDKNLFNVYVCGVINGGERAEILKKEGFEVHIINSDRQKLIALMKEKKIDIVHVHRAGFEEPFVVTAAKEANVPVILETNIFGFVDKSPSGKLFDYHLFISKMCAIRYKGLLNLSDEDFFKTGTTLYYPVTLEDSKTHSSEEIAKLKESFGFSQNDKIISRVGRPDVSKWGDNILPMMKELVKKVPDVKYAIVGVPDSKMYEISKDSEIVKHFIFMDTISPDKIADFYATIDILAHSSRGESFGYTIAEAMASKKPVVVDSTPLGENSQIELVDNGVTGFVVNSPKAYADAIYCLLENKDKAKEMGLAGYKKVKEQYETRKTTNVLEKIYVELLRKKGVALDDALIKKYGKTEYFPSESNIIDFEEEYQKRLRDCFGGMTNTYRLELLVYKYLLRMPLLFRASKKLISTVKRAVLC